MTYCSSISLAESAAGTGATYFFRANSVYDPDSSGVGTVAIPYNTWSALYLNYKVRRVTVRLSAVYSSATANSFCQVTIAPVAGQAVVPSNANTWKMIPYARTRSITPNSNGGRNVATVTASYDLAKIAHLTSQQYSSDMDFSGAVGSNPLRQLFVGVLVQPVASAGIGTVVFQINLTYDVEWFNPVPMQ